MPDEAVYLSHRFPLHPSLQVRAADLLRRADAIIYDDLGAAAAVDAYAPPTAERLYVGKRGGQPSIRQPEIDALLVATAVAAPGRTVVRLKGGCPSVFSRVRREAGWVVVVPTAAARPPS